MKFTYGICLFLLVFLHKNCGSQMSGKKYKISEFKFGNPLSKMLASIIIEFYSVESTEVSVIKASEDRKSEINQLGIINEFLYDSKDFSLFLLENTDAVGSRFSRFYNIFVIDSYKSFRKILDKKSTIAFDFSGYYTIVLTSVHKNYTDTVTKILENCWELFIINVNIVTYDPYNTERAYMITYFPYTSEHCGKVKPVVTGVFKHNTFMNNVTIFPDKVSNFHKCHLTVGLVNFPPYMTFSVSNMGRHSFGGFEGYALNALMDHLNFNVILKTHPNLWGKFNGNKSTGVSGMLYKGEVDFTIGGFGVNEKYLNTVSTTFFYYSTPVVLLIPPGRPYTSMEKLVLPFRFITWSILAVGFVISAFVVSFAKFIAPQRRAFIFGQRNNYPFINTINAFLGGSVAQVAGRNFARFLLMLWILLGIVIRICYQGALFHFLKEQTMVSLVDTIPKLIDEGFKIYGDEALISYFSEMSNFDNHFVTINGSYYQEYRLQTLDHNFKGAVLTTELSVAYLNERFASKNKYFRTTKDQVAQFYITIPMRKNSFLKVPFDKILWRYKESGLIDHWSMLFFNLRNVKLQSEQNGPQPLNIDQLSGIFVVFLVLIAFSCLIFIMEVISTKLRFVRRLTNFLN
uniref:Uncharacterized protein n=1 Tax=Phlebotomus papatasi TaxID=29031 RepID=A0A3F2ZEM7_PHLPP